jgi:hypothetical protein
MQFPTFNFGNKSQVIIWKRPFPLLALYSVTLQLRNSLCYGRMTVRGGYEQGIYVPEGMFINLGKRQSSLLKGLLPVPIKYEYSECNSL